MCGRFSFYGRQRELAAFTGIPDVPELPLRYNIAPTQSVAAVRLDGTGERELVLLRWGLVPSRAKAVTGRAPINARADAVASRPMFRAAFRSRRCLIPASGFYEWKKVGKAKQPFLFRRRDERLVAFAGLWEQWEGSGGEVLQSCAIITTDANALVRRFHDRMPVLVEPEDFDDWLAADDVDALLKPYPAKKLVSMPVSRLLNNPRNEGPKLLQASMPGRASTCPPART